MQYEQKEIPLGSGNFYWYGRWLDGKIQRSKYFGKKLPSSAVAETQQKYQQSEADRKVKFERKKIEQKIAKLSAQLAQLK